MSETTPRLSQDHPFEESSYGVYYHYDTAKQYTAEEIAEENEEEREKNAAGLEIALADGFIELPIFFRDVAGELVEKKAWVHPSYEPSCSAGFYEKHGMRHNIYVPSYGRAGNAMTVDLLNRFGAKNWYLAVDPSQYGAYKEIYGEERLILRDISFRDPSMVDLVSSIPRPNSMSGTAGIYNNLLAFSRSMGETKYWTLDDDMLGLAMKAKKGDENMKPGEVYDKNNYYRCSNIKDEYGFNFQEFMNSIEEVMAKVRNAGFAGLEKFGIVFSLPIMWKKGTRVYSFYLSDNATQLSHIGAMNNDVITSLEQSKHGMPPMLFEGISYNSGATQTGGGLTEQYSKYGTLEKGKCLVKAQPNYTKIVERYSRIHHSGDYTSYNGQRLVGTPVSSSEE